MGDADVVGDGDGDGTDPTQELTSLRSEVEHLRGQLSRVERALGELSGDRSSVSARRPEGPCGVVPSVTDDPSPIVSRRSALRTAGTLAAGALAGGAAIVATATPAAAAAGTFDGNPAVSATATVVASAVGVRGTSAGSSGTGVVGSASAANGTGVMGSASETNGTGVKGSAAGSSGIGVYGGSSGSGGVGVSGWASMGTAVSASGILGVRVVAAGTGVSIQGTTHMNFVGAQSPFATGYTYATNDLIVDTAGVVWFCTLGGTPGTWRRLGGAGTAGAFTAVTPGRVYDSRLGAYSPNGPLATGQSRTVSVANSRDPNTGSVVTSNFVPAGASAVFANVTIVDTVGSGYLAVNPGGDAVVHASTINWTASGTTVANGVALALDASRQITIVAGGPGSTGVIVDVLGYYR